VSLQRGQRPTKRLAFPYSNWLPDSDADQSEFTLSDEFAFAEARLTKWRRSLVLLN